MSWTNLTHPLFTVPNLTYKLSVFNVWLKIFYKTIIFELTYYVNINIPSANIYNLLLFIVPSHELNTFIRK